MGFFRLNVVKNSNFAEDKSIFGVPSFVIGKEIFWGNDRLEEAFEWYKKQK